MNKKFEDVLAESLDALQSGEKTLEELLTRYPEGRAELQSLLGTAKRIQSAANAQPSAAFRRQARHKLQRHMSVQKQSVTKKAWLRLPQHKLRVLTRRYSMSTRWIMIALLFASLMFTGTAYAADASAPGDALYGLDLALENVQMNLATNSTAQTQLGLQIAAERLAEAQSLSHQGDHENAGVALAGYGQAISGLARSVGSAGDADQEALSALVTAALATHTDKLNELLGKVPHQGQAGILKAIEASSKVNVIFADGVPGNAPEGSGRPEGVGDGKPEGVGGGKLEGVGGGKPEGVGGGPPDGVGPGTDTVEP